MTKGQTKNKIKHILFHSKCVKDTDPLLHGSLKQKIHVYSFQPFECSYIKRKLMKNNKKVVESFSKINLIQSTVSFFHVFI